MEKEDGGRWGKMGEVGDVGDVERVCWGRNELDVLNVGAVNGGWVKGERGRGGRWRKGNLAL